MEKKVECFRPRERYKFFPNQKIESFRNELTKQFDEVTAYLSHIYYYRKIDVFEGGFRSRRFKYIFSLTQRNIKHGASAAFGHKNHS